MGRTSDARERLMTAALDLMWEESYGAITIDDICHRAAVKKGSFYYFFVSKSELVIAALERLWLEAWKPALDAQFSPSVEPLKRIVNYLDSIYLKQVKAKSESGKVLGCPVCSVGSEISTQDEKLGAKIRELCAHKRRYFESAIRDAMAEGAIAPGDPTEKATALIGLMEGILTQARIMNDPELVRRLPGMAMDLLRAKVLLPSAP